MPEVRRFSSLEEFMNALAQLRGDPARHFSVRPGPSKPIAEIVR